MTERLSKYVRSLIESILASNPSAKNTLLLEPSPFLSCLGFHEVTKDLHLARRYDILAAMETKFALTNQEQSIFSFLLEVNAQMSLGTVFRCAGGWVRDKLLNIPSDDIDIALSNMTGSQFEAKVSEYSSLYQQKNGVPHPALGKSYTVKANPEKSKLLETVAVELYGLKIDFINLREEKYDENSRIPVMTLATGPDAPAKDAARRDLTINSLFYNINTGQVEDFVGGLEDLKTMTLRTPMDPEQTFKDDPLRMLRVLRFFSKYKESKLDPTLQKAIENPAIHNLYANLADAHDPTKKNYKVAPERAWPELKKLMEGAKPGAALRVMFESGLYKAVFNTPKFRELLPDLKMDQRNDHHAHDLLDHTLHVMDSLNNVMAFEGIDSETKMLMNFASLFHDLGKAHPDIGKENPKRPGQWQYIGHEDKSAEIADEALKTIGMGKRARSLVTQVITHHMKPHGWSKAPDGISGQPLPTDMKEVEKYYGRLHDFMDQMQPINKGDAKDKEVPGRPYSKSELSQLVVLHSMADSMGKNIKQPDVVDLDNKASHLGNMRSYSAFWSSMKPVVNGNDLMAMFPTLVPGNRVGGMSFITDIMSKVVRRQATGKIVSKEDAVAYIENMRRSIEDKYRTLPPVKQVKGPPLPLPPPTAETVAWIKTAKLATKQWIQNNCDLT